MTNSEAAVGIGIDVGGTKILAGAVAASGEVLAVSSIASPPILAELPSVIDRLLVEVLALLAQTAGAAKEIGGIGLALPGLVDPLGVVHAAPNLGAKESQFDAGAVIGPLLLDRLSRDRSWVGGAQVALENDATCAAFGEALVGAAAGARDAVVISFGTGIGAGIVANGEIVRGARHFAGEIGHLIVDPDGPLCACGRHGCWEVFASGGALTRLVRDAATSGRWSPSGELIKRAPESLDGEDIVQATRDGDAMAATIIQEFSRAVSLGLTNVVELLDPERIVIAGGLATSADILLGPIRDAFASLSRPAQRRPASLIVAAALGDRAATIGAGLLSLRNET